MFNRPEVWLLIVLAGAGSIWFAFFQEPAPELPVAPVVETSEIVEAPVSTLELLGSRSEASGEHWVIELSVRLENPTATAETLAAPFARLLDADGSEIPEFYLPFAQPSRVPAGETTTAELRYFVPMQNESLELALGDRRLPLQLDAETGGISLR